ncbi:MAG: hypothetical protein KatS3mg131_1932 [Candidatus Tectimicrobiota bacterium]|nr:MAG: hypothetical protein KatS3mg131_1932 [Candidatus Tectomicrobia bacterium]
MCQTPEEALRAVQRAMQERVFGDAGRRVVIEEFLDGEEASFHVLVDGERAVPLLPSQDHKRAYDGDQGPNTGGMGAYAPAPVVTPAVHARIMRDIVQPAVAGMAARGTPYRGVLYVGLMIVDEQPYVLEFNVRFGDPEAQCLLVTLAEDLLPLLEAAAAGTLRGPAVAQLPEAAVCVVMAAAGYPGPYETGQPIAGIEEAARLPNTWIFHAGTAVREGKLVTNGGRVLGVTSRAPTLAGAVQQAYAGVARIHWPGVHYRRDIGQRALRRSVCGNP